jgi:hypothetical protein
MATTTQTVRHQAIERKRKRFFNSLPNTLHCSHCDKRRPKERFGVRLMNGQEAIAGKKDPVFRVQPYCTPCRS